MRLRQRPIYHGEQAPSQTEISRFCSAYILELLFRYLPYWLRSYPNSFSPSTISKPTNPELSKRFPFSAPPAMAGPSGRPRTAKSANSILTFADNLRAHRTPSPTDDEAERIWEAARTAAPVFADLNLQQGASRDLPEAVQTDLPTTFHLSPGQRAVIRDATDTAGNRQSVLPVYEADDDSLAASSPVPTHGETSYDDCVEDYAHVPPFQCPEWPIRSSSRRHDPEATRTSTLASRSATSDALAVSRKGKGKAGLSKLKQAFKLAKPVKTNSSAVTQKNQPDSTNLPKVRPVDLSSSTYTRPQAAQPVPRKIVGDANRMTMWGNFSQYKAEEEALKSAPSRPPSLHLNKPLPEIPQAGSHLRMTRAPGTSSGASSSCSSSSPTGAPQRKSKHRRTAVYAGSLFSSQELSEEEVIDAYASSRPTSPVGTQTPATSDDESEGERERRELLEHLNRICPPANRETTLHLNSPYHSPELSDSVNGEIGRLHNGLDRTFDPDDEDDKSPMIDTFVHAGHTSFLITERLDESTIRSMYGTQERRDGDSPTDDPTKAI